MKRRTFLGLLLLAPLARAASFTTVGQFLSRLRVQMAPLYGLGSLRQEYARLVQKHGLPQGEAEFRRYVRLRTLFEATRAGGLWHTYWNITNQAPDSRQIWRQWCRPLPNPRRATAVAECDELSALLAFLCRKMEVPGVGLFWPTKNHTVAVWMPTVRARIVVPTSQIFLSQEATLDTREFNPFSQPTIYEYQAQDVADAATLPSDLSDFFLDQINRYAAATLPALAWMRSARAAWQLGHTYTKPPDWIGESFKLRFQQQY